MKLALLPLLALLGACATGGVGSTAQSRTLASRSQAAVSECRCVSFEGAVSAREAFQQELGNGLSFTVYAAPDGGAWTMRIGPGRQPTGPSDIGWSLDYAWNEEWQFGQTHGRDAEASMKASPRLLWFAVNAREYRRLRAAFYRAFSSNLRIALSGESKPSQVIAEMQRGVANVAISSFRLGATPEGQTNIAAVQFGVTVNVPRPFPLVGGAPCECPTHTLIFDGAYVHTRPAKR